MKQTVFSLVVACCMAIPVCAFKQSGGTRHGPETLELYSWQNVPEREWYFCILVNTSREKTVNEVFNKRTALRGVDELKRKISGLPAGSTLIWASQLTAGPGIKAKGSERLRYPPTEIIEKVKEYAKTRNIQILP